MPISAIGRKSNLRLAHAHLIGEANWRGSRGFTLLEILVVLVIVAAMAAMLVFSFHDSSQQKLRREASELAALLNAAADEAVMRGMELGVVIDNEGYRFVAFDPETKAWREAANSGLTEHKFPEHFAIDFALDGSEVDEKTIERIKLLARRSEDERLRPSILILSSGEITPFKLTLRTEQTSDEADANVGAISLRSDGLNPVMLDADAVAKDKS